MTSFQKKDSNKRNATKSTGPKTQTGKRHVRLNALKHGFYAHELTVSEADERDFEILRESLRAQLAPRTAVQDVGFEQIVTCCWRCKLAIRMEMHQLKVHFTTNDESASSESAPQRDIRETQWYGASSAALRYGISLLEDLRKDVSANGPLHLEARKDQIMKAFGVGFYDSLTEWKHMGLDAIYAAEFLTLHRKTFDRGDASPPDPPEGVKIVADPKQKQQMLVKLIDVKAQHLLDLRQISSEASYVQQTGPNEFAPRYFATASRDLQRAVSWY